MGEISGNGTAVRGLGGAKGFGETELLRGDDTVARVDVRAVFGAGFKLGDQHFAGNELYVSTDGMVSFGAGLPGIAAPPAPFFAIFNADIDTRLDGEGAESGAVWVDVDTARDCVTITWDHVGFYRRNASLTDTFQMQLFDRGGGAFDVVYRYQDISWTSGDLQGGWDGLGGTAAMIGYRLADSGAATLLPASGNEAAQLALETAAGNTGVKGLWVFHIGEGTGPITGTAGVDRLEGTSGDDSVTALAGDDVLLGSGGADLLDGGAGLDWVDYGAARGAVLVDLARPAAGRGQAAGDRFQGIEGIAGSNFADSLMGASQSDRFMGGKGKDALSGMAGNDSLSGGEGDDAVEGGTGGDVLQGGFGNDTLLGGVGDDTLTGGPGADAFIFSGMGRQGHDRITDYNAAAGDYLDLGRDSSAADYKVTYVREPGAGLPGVREAHITYVPTGLLIWVLVDGAAETSIMVQSSMNSFDLA